MTTGGAEHGGGPTARRMVLGAHLRRLRESVGITRSEAGYQIRSSESKISRLELGRVGFKERDVADLLTMYGVADEQERDNFLGMVKESNKPGWWQSYSDVMPRWLDNFVGLEEAASRLQVYELQFIPGLMQTEDYARAVVSHGSPDPYNDVMEQRVAFRMRRQKILQRPDAPRLWAVIDESVLHRPIGGHAVLLGQIEKLLELTATPHISLQVVEMHRSGYAAEGAFTLLRFAEPELPNIAYIEHLSGSLLIERLDEVEPYSRALDRLAVDALTPDQTRQFLLKRRSELRSDLD
ncbi:helix-turn-helix domain-containing protein [Amycolatopsis palatopharyngis]|uniref:helix-turn-helix domain-containing protein n=1 Tax=Amycolatopsis palatopharyngis TaxID=187982 RepID=UPI000E27DFD8|nr:helix-turn-helix transcriptional regulator [Amycolatopsis palatopharyngis]